MFLVKPKSRLIAMSLIITLALVAVVGYSQVRFVEQSALANALTGPNYLKLEVSSGEIRVPSDHEVKIVVRDKDWEVVTCETGFVNSEIVLEFDEVGFYTVQVFVEPLANGTIFERIDPVIIKANNSYEKKISVTLKPLFHSEPIEDDKFDEVFNGE